MRKMQKFRNHLERKIEEEKKAYEAICKDNQVENPKLYDAGILEGIIRGIEFARDISFLYERGERD